MHVDKVNSPTCRLKSNHAIGNVAAACIMLRPAPSARQSHKEGFGMVKVSGPHVAVDWDAAQLLKP